MKFVVSVLLLLAVPASAQDPAKGTISLTDAVAMALDRNYAVKRAANEVEALQASVLSSYGNFMPTVSLNSSWSGGQQFFNGVALGESDIRSFNSSVSANMTLFDGFSNTASYTMASSSAVAGEFDLSRARQSVSAQATRLFYEVLRTRRLLEVAEQSVKYSRQQLERVQETARLGSASLVNVYQQQAQVGLDEVSLVQAQNNYDVARANVSAYLVLPLGSSMEFVDPSIPLEIDSAQLAGDEYILADISTLAQRAYDRRPDYESGKLALKVQDAAVTSASSGYFPVISTRLSYAFNGRTVLDSPGGEEIIRHVDDGSGGVTHAVLLSPAVPYTSEFSNFQDNSSLNWSLSLSFPLFSGFRTNESVQRAQVQKRSAELALQEKERTIQVEVTNASLLLQAAKKTYEAAVKSLQFQDQNLKVNQEKYNVGSGTLLDLLLAQNNYNSAQASKINAVYSYLNARAQLEYAIGAAGQ